MNITASDSGDSMNEGLRVAATWPPQPLTRKDFEQAKRATLEALRGYGITELTASYDGYGDEGGFNLLDCQPQSASACLREPAPEATKKLAEFCRGETRTSPVIEAIFDLAAVALEARFAGWETGEGATGELLIDVVQGKFVLRHSRRVAYEYPDFEV